MYGPKQRLRRLEMPYSNETGYFFVWKMNKKCKHECFFLRLFKVSYICHPDPVTYDYA